MSNEYNGDTIKSGSRSLTSVDETTGRAGVFKRYLFNVARTQMDKICHLRSPKLIGTRVVVWMDHVDSDER